MRKIHDLSKIAVTLTAVIMTMTMAVGCGNSATTASTNTVAVSSTQASKTTTSENKTDGTSSMATISSNTLKDLVKAGTITQAQSDKVLEVLKKDVPPQGGNMPAGNAKPSGNPPTGDNPSGTAPSGTAPNGTKPTGSDPNSNRLSELVTSKVISQAQADTINQKIQEVMKNNKPINNTTTQTK